MDLRQLKCFLAVAETLHFRKAAELLNMSQPPLSAAVMSLEADLEVKLFERSTRNVRLTEAGSALKQQGTLLMQELNRIVGETKRIGEGLSGRLAIGFVGISMNLGLPKHLKEFRARYPDILISLDELPSHLLVEALLGGKLDIAFVRVLDRQSETLRSKIFAEESYFLAIPESAELARRKSVKLEHLDRESLLFFPRHFHPEIYDTWMDVFRKAKIQPEMIQEARSLQTELGLVAAGMGMALVAASVAKEAREGIVFRRLHGTIPKVKVHALWHPDRETKALKNLLRLL